MSFWRRGTKRRTMFQRSNLRWGFRRSSPGSASRRAGKAPRAGWTRRLASMVLWSLVLGAGVWGAVTAYHELGPLAADWFRIRHVDVAGTDIVTREEVMEHLSLRADDTLLSFDSEAAAGRLKSHAWIKDAIVSRVPFHTVSVRLTERRAAAVLRGPALNLLLDEEGHVLAIMEDPTRPERPLLHGIDPARLIQGNARARRTARDGIRLAGLVGQVFDGPRRVDAGDPLNFVAHVQGRRFHFGPSSFEEKWALYQMVQPKLWGSANHARGNATSEIDLRYPNKVIVRERG